MTLVGDWLQAGLVALAALLVAGSGCRPLTKLDLRRWADRFGAPIDAETRVLVVDRLRHVRMVRSIAIAVGLTTAGLPAYLNLIARDHAASFANQAVSATWIIAAALGCLVAEVLVVQRPKGNRGAALQARQTRDYVSLVWLRVIAATIPFATGSALVATFHGEQRVGIAWAGACASIAALVAVLAGLRRITDRPALAPDGPIRAIDDALRADGAHHLVGAGIALAVVGAVIAVGPVLTAFGAWLSLLTLPVSYLALGIWWALARDTRWSVNRRRATVK
jgi:hypothetical protein